MLVVDWIVVVVDVDGEDFDEIDDDEDVVDENSNC